MRRTNLVNIFANGDLRNTQFRDIHITMNANFAKTPSYTITSEQVGSALRFLRERLGLTLEDAAGKVGLTHSSLSRIENGKQELKFSAFSQLAQVYGRTPSEVISLAETGNVMDAQEIQGTVPLISWVQAGHWREAADPLQPGEGERIPTTYRARAHTYALRVRGDSMEPKFPDGCIIVVEPDDSPEPGQYVIVRQNGDEATFKQLIQDGGRLYLKPLNSRYPILEMKSDAVFCGVVKRLEMDV